MEVPNKVDRRSNQHKRKYKFSELEVGQDKGDHFLCRTSDRDRIWSSIRQLCYQYSGNGKVFKCYPTETGVFYWREK